MASRNFRNLVFEGGGVKGIAYGGALEVLDKAGVLKNVTRVAGTSAGAINATLLAIGFTHREVSDIIAKTNFASFEDGGWFGSKLQRLLTNFGIHRGDKFKSFLEEKIKLKTGSTKFTFKNLAQAIQTGNANFKYLYVVATNLSGQKYEIFSHEEGHFPDTPIADAVRMSMSIPMYFQAVTFNKETMVDGGVSYNYGVNIFDQKKYLHDPENGDAQFYNNKADLVFNHETLGFRLDSTEVINYCKKNWSLPPVKIDNLNQYVSALIGFMMEMANKAHLVDEDWNRTIFIDTLDVKTTDFNLSQQKINALVASGTTGVEKYFAWRDGDVKWAALPV
jgi:NTE family protein